MLAVASRMAVQTHRQRQFGFVGSAGIEWKERSSSGAPEGGSEVKYSGCRTEVFQGVGVDWTSVALTKKTLAIRMLAVSCVIR